MKSLLDREGSDKGRWYGGLYDVLLQPHRRTIRCVIEIGIGTLIAGAPSTMCGFVADGYRPGGSLRAWRDFLPNAEIFGIDVAPDTQFWNEPRITTYLCDSTNAEQTQEVFRRVRIPPDLVVDDGLHGVNAQVGTLRNFFPALREGGLYVVEDVHAGDVATIIEAGEALHRGCHAFVDRSWGTLVAVVIRKGWHEEELVTVQEV